MVTTDQIARATAQLKHFTVKLETDFPNIWEKVTKAYLIPPNS